MYWAVPQPPLAEDSLNSLESEKHTGIGVDNQSIDLETHNAAPYLKINYETKVKKEMQVLIQV